MNYNCTGQIMYKIRTKCKVTQMEVSSGICGVKDMSKFETGERKPDIFLLNALLQRMGTSTDILELFVSEEEIELFQLRTDIEEMVRQGRYEEGLFKLGELTKYKDAKKPLHSQFVSKMRSMIHYLQHNNVTKSISCARNALRITLLEDENGEIWDKKLHLEEQLIIIMLAYYHDVRGDCNKSTFLLRRLRNYIEKQITDVSEKVKIYPQVMYLLAKQYTKTENHTEVLECCKAGIDLLIIDGHLIPLIQLLELQAASLQHLEQLDKYHDVASQLECLTGVLQEYGYDISLQITRLFIHRNSSTLYSMAEVIRKNRLRLGISQEELCYDICAPESLSKIEGGKSTPRVETYTALATKLNHKYAICSLLLEVDDLEVLDLKKEIARLSMANRYEDMKAKINILNEEVIRDTAKNRQYMMYIDALCALKLGEIEPEEALQRMLCLIDKGCLYASSAGQGGNI